MLQPCFGGWLHGFFFSLPIPLGLLGHPIPQLEFLAVIAAKITFRRLVSEAPMMLLTDSETSFHVLDHDGARHEQMQHLHLEYLASGGTFNGASHTYGDANPFADFASRGRIDELRELAAQHGTRARELLVPDEFADVLARFRDQFGPCPYTGGPRTRRSLAPHVSSLAAHSITTRRHTDTDTSSLPSSFAAQTFPFASKGDSDGAIASATRAPSPISVNGTEQGGLAAHRLRASATPAPRGSSTVPIDTFKSQQRSQSAAPAAKGLAVPGSSRDLLSDQSK